MRFGKPISPPENELETAVPRTDIIRPATPGIQTDRSVPDTP